jgi:beta-glucosidase
VRRLGSAFPGPRLELKGFRRVFIPRGETLTVGFALRTDDLAFWDVPKSSWSVESGRVEIMLGASSADVRVCGVVEIISSAGSMKA